MIIYEDIFKRHGFSKTQLEIIKIVGKKRVVLEIGSSTGYMSKAFLDNHCVLDVVEKDKWALKKLPKSTRSIFNKSLEDIDLNKLKFNDYDFIILADVLEHLIDPEKALKALHKIANRQTKLIVSLPNIASWVMRKQLFFSGDFEYQESGLLDKTHLHFFSVNSLPKFLSANGWKVEELTGTIIRIPFQGTVSKIPFFGRILQNFLINYIAKRFKNLSFYHFLVVAYKK